MMRKIFHAAVALIVLVGGPSAIFAEEAIKARPVPWEVILVNPDKFDGEGIQIDGYLRVIYTDDGSCEFELYTDKDSLEKRRDFRFLEIDKEDFLKALGKNDLRGQQIRDLDRLYVTMQARFSKSELESETNLKTGRYRAGVLKGPLRCIPEGKRDVIEWEKK